VSWSSIQAARATGESSSAYPIVCGRVALLQEVAKAASPECGERIGRGALLLGFLRLGDVARQTRHEQVRVDADQPIGCLAGHRVGDGRAHVAALSHVSGIAEAPHQLRPRGGDTAVVPAELSWLAGESVAGKRWQYDVERIVGACAMSGRIGERTDSVEQFDDRSRPAVRHDERQCVLMRRPHVDEMDVDPVDLGHELW
jgi:hypothetical protein